MYIPLSLTWNKTFGICSFHHHMPKFKNFYPAEYFADFETRTNDEYHVNFPIILAALSVVRTYVEPDKPRQDV